MSGSATSFEVEINTEYRTAVRFPAWMVLTVFSAVSLTSIAARISPDERGSEERWAMAVASLSMCIGLLGTAAYLFIRGIYVGQIPEAIMVSETLLPSAGGGCMPSRLVYSLTAVRFCINRRLPSSWPFGALGCPPL